MHKVYGSLILLSIFLSSWCEASSAPHDLMGVVKSYQSKPTVRAVLMALESKNDPFVMDALKHKGSESKLPAIKLDGDFIILEEFPHVRFNINFTQREIKVLLREHSVILTNDMTFNETLTRIASLVEGKNVSWIDVIISSAHAEDSIMSLAPLGRTIINGLKGIGSIAKDMWNLEDKALAFVKDSAKRCDDLHKLDNISEMQIEEYTQRQLKGAERSFLCNPKYVNYDKTNCDLLVKSDDCSYSLRIKKIHEECQTAEISIGKVKQNGKRLNDLFHVCNIRFVGHDNKILCENYRSAQSCQEAALAQVDENDSDRTIPRSDTGRATAAQKKQSSAQKQ